MTERPDHEKASKLASDLDNPDLAVGAIEMTDPPDFINLGRAYLDLKRQVYRVIGGHRFPMRPFIRWPRQEDPEVWA